jgi:hypothetical protein
MAVILQPTAAPCGSEFLKFLSDCKGGANEEFCIAVILEKQLEMLRIKPELTEAAANLTGKSVIRGGPGPPLISRLVHELEKAAIPEEQAGFRELRVCDVIGDAMIRQVSQCQRKIALIFC